MKSTKFIYLAIYFISLLVAEKNLALAANVKNKKIEQKSKIDSINTIGNYLTFNYINTKGSYDEFLNFTKTDFTNTYNFYNYGYKYGVSPARSRNSFGIKYGYAINFKDFFLMPEIYYDHTKLFLNSQNNYGGPHEMMPNLYGYKYLKINKIYGSKINLGYDLNHFLSIYGSAGYSIINYSALSSFDTYDALKGFNVPLKPIRKNKLVPTYGFGLKIKINKNFNLISEYQRLNLKTSLLYTKQIEAPMRANGSFFNAKITVAKIGISYNF